MPETRIAPYAIQQMRERELSEHVVREAVESPDQVVEGKLHRKIAQKRMRGADKDYLVRVIYEQTGDLLVVVTAYKTSKIAKYWREQ